MSETINNQGNTETTPDVSIEQRANQCLAEINIALKKFGFDIQVFHELSTTKNSQGGTEITVQHVQKFVPAKVIVDGK